MGLIKFGIIFAYKIHEKIRFLMKRGSENLIKFEKNISSKILKKNKRS